MKFTFNGGDDKDAKTDFLGIDWVRGMPVEVGDEATIARLKAHPHFDAEGEASHAAEDNRAANAFADQPAPAVEAEHHEAVVELSDLSDEELDHLTSPDAPAEPLKSKGGRPKGSKNKPKVTDGDQNDG